MFSILPNQGFSSKDLSPCLLNLRPTRLKSHVRHGSLDLFISQLLQTGHTVYYSYSRRNRIDYNS